MKHSEMHESWSQYLRECARSIDPIGIVGLGSIGKRYARILREHGLRVFAFEVNQTIAQEIASKTGVVTRSSMESLLSEKLSFCIVATPPDQHLQPAEAALWAGVPALVEKPLAHTLADSEALVRIAEKSGTACYCVCNMRFHPGLRALHHNRHRAGEICFVRAHFGHRLSQMRPAGTNIFAASSEMGGGVILDCIHEFDYLQAMLGPLHHIKSTTASLGPDKIAAEDWARIELQTIDGMPVSLDLDFISRRKNRGCELIGSEGSVIWSSLGRSPEEVSVTFSDDRVVQSLYNKCGLNADEEYGLMLADMIRSLSAKSLPMIPIQTVQEAARSLSLCLQALEDC